MLVVKMLSSAATSDAPVPPQVNQWEAELGVNVYSILEQLLIVIVWKYCMLKVGGEQASVPELFQDK